MSSTANPNVLDAAGAVSKPAFKSGFLQPVVDDINALQGGATIRMDGVDQRPGSLLSVSDLVLVRTSAATYAVRLDQLGVALGAVRPILTKEDLGIVGDGVTDDAPALQAAAEQYSALGGAVFMLRAQPGKRFFFKGSPRLASDISVIFVSGHRVTKTSRLLLRGELTGTTAANEFRLLVDSASGDTSIRVDTSPHGGAAVSTYFAVGDYIRVRGLRDSCGTALESQELRVTSVTDGTATLGLSAALNASFKVTYPAGDFEAAQGTVNFSIITKLVSALATSDVSAGSNLWPIAVGDIGKFTMGDVVMVHSEATCADVGGSSTFGTHCEMAQVIASVPGDPTASLRLSRRVERNYTTAKFGRLVKVSPIRNALINSATVEFTEAPDPGSIVHAYEIRYGVDCGLVDCSVPNTDLFGSRGAGCVISRSLACSIERPVVRGPKFVDSGEGNGVVLTSATDCRVVGGTLADTRHALQAFGATNCLFESVIVQNPRQSPIDCHGGWEVGVRYVNIQASAATDYEADPGNAPVVIAWGNPTHQAGAYDCSVEGGLFTGFRAEDGNSEGCIQTWAPSTNCVVRGARFKRIGTLFTHVDTSGSGTLVSRGCSIENCIVDDWTEKLVEVFSRVNGASVDTLVDFTIRGLIARNGSRFIDVENATEFEVYDCVFDEVTVDAGFPYVLSADTCPGLVWQNNIVTGSSRGLSFTNCTNFRALSNRFVDLTSGTVYHDGGGNTGIWVGNDAVGTTPTANRAGGSAITEGPRAAGVWEMADQTFIAFRPERRSGVCKVWSHLTSEVFAEFMFRCHGDSGGLQVVPDADTTTLNVDVTTGALTGTTGVYDAFTISVTDDGRLWFENQLGHGIVIDFSVS